MRQFSVVVALVCSASGLAAEATRTVPLPRLKLDPVTRAAVAEQAAKVAEVEIAAAKAASVAKGGNGATGEGEESPILLGKYVVRERGKGAKEAPKQETFEGRFTPLKGGRILGRKRYDFGFWPSLEFTKVAGTAMREGGPRLNVDLLRVRW